MNYNKLEIPKIQALKQLHPNTQMVRLLNLLNEMGIRPDIFMNDEESQYTVQISQESGTPRLVMDGNPGYALELTFDIQTLAIVRGNAGVQEFYDY